MYEDQLKELGLTDNEVKIYLLLLRKGSMNPSEISQKLGLHRGYVYDALERMQEKEAINLISKDNKKQFQATNPEHFVELLKLKLEKFQQIIPNLIEINESQKEETKVEMHKGNRVYRILIKDVLSSIKNGSEVLLIGVDEEILTNEIEPIYLDQYLNSIKSRNIKERIIIKNNGKRLKNKNLQYKNIDRKYIGNTAQIIYSSKVAIFIVGYPHYLILIDNKKVADTYRSNFEALWKIAKK